MAEAGPPIPSRGATHLSIRLQAPGIARHLALVAGLLLLAACQSTERTEPLPEIDFSDRAAIRLNVAEIAIEPAFVSPRQSPNVEHRFARTPLSVIERWARQRLVAAGDRGTARVVVLDASVTETNLPVTRGVRGAFVREQSSRYDAKAELEIEILDEFRQAQGSARATAMRSVTTSESATLLEKEEVWDELTRNLVGDLDLQLEQTIRRVLFRYVVE